MKIEKNCRGFSFTNFTDRYGVSCSLQKSSLATEDAIWLGCDDANPRHSVNGKWEPVELPNGTVCDTRMHLTVDMVKALLPMLQKFVETGEI